MQGRAINIYITGFMGSGKSSVGKKLAATISWKFLDLDDLIEKREGLKINEIFKERGERYFREVERRVLEDISSLKGYVISLGGGTFCFRENILLLKKSGKVIWLKCPLSEIFNRIKFHSERPLAKDRKTLANLYYYRLNFYREADYSIENYGKSINRCVDEIVFILKLRGIIA